MKNIQQVFSVSAKSPEELQELLNDELRVLGARVVDVHFLQALDGAHGAHVVYWTHDIDEEIIYKIDTLPEDPYAKAEERVFVAVLHEYQRAATYSLLTDIVKMYEKTNRFGDAEKFKKIAARFAAEDEEQLE